MPTVPDLHCVIAWGLILLMGHILFLIEVVTDVPHCEARTVRR